MKMHPWNGFGAKSRPGRLQGESGMKKFGFLDGFWLKMELQCAILEFSWDPTSVKNRTFGLRSAQGPSKNDLREGGWKKHEN